MGEVPEPGRWQAWDADRYSLSLWRVGPTVDHVTVGRGTRIAARFVLIVGAFVMVLGVLVAWLGAVSFQTCTAGGALVSAGCSDSARTVGFTVLGCGVGLALCSAVLRVLAGFRPTGRSRRGGVTPESGVGSDGLDRLEW